MQTTLMAEINQARVDWERAWENFNNADKEFVDAAIWQLQAATERYDALMRLAKGGLVNAHLHQRS